MFSNITSFLKNLFRNVKFQDKTENDMYFNERNELVIKEKVTTHIEDITNENAGDITETIDIENIPEEEIVEVKKENAPVIQVNETSTGNTIGVVLTTTDNAHSTEI